MDSIADFEVVWCKNEVELIKLYDFIINQLDYRIEKEEYVKDHTYIYKIYHNVKCVQKAGGGLTYAISYWRRNKVKFYSVKSFIENYK